MTRDALIHFNHKDSGSLTTWADMRTSAWKPNYGDMLVCAAIIRQLKLGETHRVGFGYPAKQASDRGIVRGSTYLHRNFDFAGANATLDSIGAPVCIVGLGAQAATEDVTILDDVPAARGFIARLNEMGRSISVRGRFTAAVVERLGGRDIRVTGCPSLFYTGRCPEVAVPEMLSDPHRALGISLHTGLTGNIFCHAPEAARRTHVEAIRYAIDHASRVELFEQGVMREFTIADHTLPFEERLAAAQETLKALGGADLLTPKDLLGHMVSVKSIEEWLARARDLDAIVGFRFHGNMVALLQGRPCYYWTYDTRLKEFCEIYSLPQQDVTDDWRDPVRAMLDHDWTATNAAMHACYDDLRAFYTENGFETVLPESG